MIKIIKVTGNSLSPLFLSGDFVIIDSKSRLHHSLTEGDIVVVDHTTLGTIIKKVRHNYPTEEYLELEGTHPASTPSDKIGQVPYQDIVGKVIHHVKRPR
jgi:SOS-response transcriptional repressor LexA